jgi:hypothetical protein
MDDKRWFSLIREFYQEVQISKHHDGRRRGVFQSRNWKDLTPVFDQYLRHTAVPVLELKFADGAVSYRWKVDEKNFVMPVKVGSKRTGKKLCQPQNGKR